jgi:DNA-directed RNA polymerase beta' subunit
MTKKLEDLFDLPSSTADTDETVPDIATTQYAITEIDNAIDKIDAALPGVRDLEASDGDMDELAQKATETFDDLMDLGMQIDSRYASEIFAVAGAMLGHALTAKTAKMNKKLKMIQLQLQKARLDLDREKRAGDNEEESVETAEGQVLSRNDLLDRLIGTRDQKNKPA